MRFLCSNKSGAVEAEAEIDGALGDVQALFGKIDGRFAAPESDDYWFSDVKPQNTEEYCQNMLLKQFARETPRNIRHRN